MLTKEQALEIAKKEVPEIEELMFDISLEKPRSRGYRCPPENCWHITYSKHKNITFISSDVISIDCESGKILFKGNLSDEG